MTENVKEVEVVEAVKPKSKRIITVGEKACRLNPYKRITKGTTFKVTIDGNEIEVIQDTAGKYTYLAVDGVDCYISSLLVEGAEYTTSEYVSAPKQSKRAKKAKLKAEAEDEDDDEDGDDAEDVNDAEDINDTVSEAPAKPKRSKKA